MVAVASRARGATDGASISLDVERKERDMSLDELLETWSVYPPGSWENETGPAEWYAVANNNGIVAYFGKETDAYRFRLDAINRALNP